MPTKRLPSDKWATLELIEKWYRQEKDARVKVRLNAIRLLMKGYARKEVASILCVGESTVSDWRKKWDRAGKEGLASKYKGTSSKITDDMRIEIEDIIEIKREINGRTVTGKLIHGYIKKNSKLS